LPLGTDHAGFALKETVAEAVLSLEHGVLDLGAKTLIPDDDYPDYARLVAEAVVEGRAGTRDPAVRERRRRLCRRQQVRGDPGPRSATTRFSARQGVEDDAMNVLCLGARVVGPALVTELVRVFLTRDILERRATPAPLGEDPEIRERRDAFSFRGATG